MASFLCILREVDKHMNFIFHHAANITAALSRRSVKAVRSWTISISVSVPKYGAMPNELLKLLDVPNIG